MDYNFGNLIYNMGMFFLILVVLLWLTILMKVAFRLQKYSCLYKIFANERYRLKHMHDVLNEKLVYNGYIRFLKKGQLPMTIAAYLSLGSYSF